MQKVISWINHGLWCFFVLVAILPGKPVHAANKQPLPQSELTVSTAKNGKKLYAENCSVCHGDSGKGAVWGGNLLRTPPRNFTTVESRTVLSRERMINSVTNGVPGTAMAGFHTQLSKQAIEKVVDYIKTALMIDDKKFKHPGANPHAQGKTNQSISEIFPNMGVIHQQKILNSGKNSLTEKADMSASMPELLQGDFVNGKALYQQNCVTCHGSKGDGEGPRAYFIFPRPLNFKHALAKRSYNRPTLFTAISKGKPGTEMPAWETVLKHQQIADISEYVFNQFIHSDHTKHNEKKSK